MKHVLFLLHTDDPEANPNLKTALNLVWDARDVWFNLGLQLDIEVKELQLFERNQHGWDSNDGDSYDENSGQCFREMLSVWLKSSPCWEDLATALECASVDHTDMAIDIRRIFGLPEVYCECSYC